MNIDMHHLPSSGDPLDTLIARVVDCGGAMSQIVSNMAASQLSGRSSPDAPPIPVVLQGLLRDVLGPVVAKHSESAVMSTAAMLEEVTETICEEIFIFPPPDASSSAAGRSTRGNSRSRRRR